MNRFTQYAAPTILLGAIVFGFQNCAKAGFGTDGAAYDSLSTKYGEPPICDPLSGAGGRPVLSDDHGLVGKLIYESAADQKSLGTPNSWGELVQRGTVAPATLFMSWINVPTRSFTEGFASVGSTPLTDASTGDKLVEWFGIDMVSTLKLGAGDGAGYYQFATISDDGSILAAIVDGVETPLVNNDQLHSTAAKCSTQAIYLDAKAALSIHYQYFQGPRTEIASIIAWRKVASAKADVGDCASAMTYAKGWTVIPAQNFYLPADAPKNPCN